LEALSYPRDRLPIIDENKDESEEIQKEDITVLIKDYFTIQEQRQNKIVKIADKIIRSRELLEKTQKELNEMLAKKQVDKRRSK